MKTRKNTSASNGKTAGQTASPQTKAASKPAADPTKPAPAKSGRPAVKAPAAVKPARKAAAPSKPKAKVKASKVSKTKAATSGKAASTGTPASVKAKAAPAKATKARAVIPEHIAVTSAAAKATRRVARSRKPATPAPAPSAAASASPKPRTKVTVKVRARRPSTRIAKAVKQPFGLPAELLAGDQPSTASASGSGRRYALGAGSPPDHGGSEPGDLPSAYGTKRLLLAARDPHWIYAAWDLTREQQRKYNSLSRDRHLIVRVLMGSQPAERIAEVHVHPESRFWFIHVGRGGTRFTAEIGFYTDRDEWIVIARSQPTVTPPDTATEAAEPVFATIPLEIPLPTLVAAIREELQAEATAVPARQTDHPAPLIEAIQQLRTDGNRDLPPVEVFTAGKAMTAAQERALAEIVSMDEVRRAWIGSLEITELIRRRIEQGRRGEGQPGGPELGAGGQPPGGLSSPLGGAPARSTDFWFNVNAELIIYGATQPDAQVNIAGRPIKLRPDGTFSFRFALPDGQYELPAIATSADQSDSRQARLKFSRATQYTGSVGAHPQDTTLKPPGPQALA